MGFMTALAVASVATAGAGLFMQQQGSQNAQSANRQAAASAREQSKISGQMAQLSGQFSQQEQGINIRAADLSVQGAERSQTINQDILGLERRVEGQRFQAMELDARRRSLEILRLQQRARSQALSVATAQGAGRGSGLQGAYGGISGQTGTNLLGVQQNLGIGRNIFALNSSITDQRIGYSDLLTDLARQQASLTTEKSNLLASYARQNADLQTQYAHAGGSLATAQSRVNAGQSQAAMGGSLINFGGQLFSAGTNLYNNIPGSAPTPAPTYAFSSNYGQGSAGYIA